MWTCDQSIHSTVRVTEVEKSFSVFSVLGLYTTFQSRVRKPQDLIHRVSCLKWVKTSSRVSSSMVCCLSFCCRKCLPRSRFSLAVCVGAQTMVWTRCLSPVFSQSSVLETGWCLTTPEPTVSEWWENRRRPYTSSSLHKTGESFQ